MRLSRIFFFSLSIFTASMTAFGAAYYVVPDGNDAADGLSWEAALGTVQCAIDRASNGDIVVLGEGTYTGLGNRDIDYAGKAITVRSSEPDDPNVVAATIIDCNGTPNEPHRGFWFHSGETDSSVLEGITIMGGYQGEAYGGAILCEMNQNESYGGIPPEDQHRHFRFHNGQTPDYSSDSQAIIDEMSSNAQYGASPTIRKCVIAGNYANCGGGAIANYCSSPTIVGCTFTGNSSICDGGAIKNESCLPSISDCTFLSNSSASWGGAIGNYALSPYVPVSRCTFTGNYAVFGGAISCDDGPVQLQSCLFLSNYADEAGSAMMCNGSCGNSVIQNCTFAGHAGAVFAVLNDGSAYLTNSILWNLDATNEILNEASITVSYSDIRGGYEGTGNFDQDPNFAADGYHLLLGSPCFNAGDPSLSYADLKDLDGGVRAAGLTADAGAVELNNVYYVDGSVSASGGGTSWAGAFRTLEEALRVEGVTEVRVAAGTYIPNELNEWNVIMPFYVDVGVRVVGGYPATGGPRDFVQNRTILSGNGGAVENVVEGVGGVIDGVVITGAADMGVFCTDMDIVNCEITANVGDGVWCDGGARLTNCLVTNNAGCGVFAWNESLVVLTNCTVASNTAPGLYVCDDWDAHASATVRNSIIWNGLVSENSTFWISLDHSCVLNYAAWMGGTGNTGGYPCFISTSNPQNFRLAAGSPCIDNGAPGSYTGQVDMDGYPRMMRNAVDMGAYETYPTVYYVDLTAGTGRKCGTSWADAFTDIAPALASLDNHPEVTEIWVADGTYVLGLGLLVDESVSIYGGFQGLSRLGGGETLLSQRNPVTNVTTVSGGNVSSITCFAVFECATIDGFTIAAGTQNSGCGIGFSSGYTTVTNCTFTGCDSGISCGAASSPLIENCTFVANGHSDYTGHYVGQGISIDSSSSPHVTGCSFGLNLNCAIYARTSSTSAVISNCVFDNTAATQDNTYRGIYIAGSSPTIDNCLFVKNKTRASSTEVGGGAILIPPGSASCTPHITDCIFLDNRAPGSTGNGGAIAFCGNAWTTGPTVERCIFSNNTAAQNGGAVYVSGMWPNLYNCLFCSNTAVSGGAMAVQCNNGQPKITAMNCTFYGNQSTGGTNCGGGVLYASRTSSQYYSNPTTLTNCILWGNTATTAGHEVYCTGGTAGYTVTATLKYCDIQNTTNWKYEQNSSSTVTDSPYSTYYNRYTTPVFIDASNLKGADGTWFTGDDGFMLQPCDCRNHGYDVTGYPSYITEDITGNDRERGSAVDIGAYEYRE